jgi:transposase InsO family protein
MNAYEPKYMQLQLQKLENIIHKKQTVTSVAKEMFVSRQTVHKWLVRYKRFGADGIIRKPRRRKRKSPPPNKTPTSVEQCIIELARKYCFDGVETLSDRLQYEYRLTLNSATIYRILKRNNIRYGDQHTYTRKKWKKQLFAHQEAGQELQMDTKYPHGYKQGKVVYTVIDDASRWVFAWGYSRANANNTVDFVNKMLKRVPFSVQKIRTDQGTEFLNDKLKHLLKKHNIEHRKNTPYCPEENGKIERFHSTLTQKAFRFGFYPDEPLEDMQYKLNLFLQYYNYRKKHRGLNMNGLTPMQKLNELASVNLTLQCHLNSNPKCNILF